MDHQQVNIDFFGVTVKHQRFVRVAQFRQIIVVPPSIGAHNSALGDILSHEFHEFLGSTTRHEAEKLKAGIRAKVEYPFRVIKRQFGFVKVRYRDLKKNTTQLVTLFALSNLRTVRGKLIVAQG